MLNISGLKEGKAMLTGKTVQSGATVRINVEVAKPINTDKISLNSDLNDVTTDEEGNTVYNVAKGNSFYVKPVITMQKTNGQMMGFLKTMFCRFVIILQS